MTFERFYSIVRPHKAASFNTVKKAQITTVCYFVFFTIFNVPHSFLTDVDGLRCVPWGKADNLFGQFHFYSEMVIAFILPFVLLLIMNCVIINTLRNRSNIRSESQGQGQTNRAKSSENQITVTLLVVTFSFLLLTTPLYLVFIYLTTFGMGTTPKEIATFYLIYQVGEKSFYTNFAINFYLYVISGQKCRTDVAKMFRKTQQAKVT